TRTRSSRDARKVSSASRAAQTPDAAWFKSPKMEVRRCVGRTRDAQRRSEGQGQEHEEEHGKEAGSKDAEREAAGQEGEEVVPARWARATELRLGRNRSPR